MSVKQISIFLENKPGSLYDLTMTLSDNDINIRALTVAEGSDKLSLIKLIVDNFLWTASILKNAGFAASFVDVLVVKVSNVPGGLNRVLEILCDAKINIEHTYSIISNSSNRGGVQKPIWFLR